MIRFSSSNATHLQGFDDMDVWYCDDGVFIKTKVFLRNHNTFLHQILIDERTMFLGHQHFSGPISRIVSLEKKCENFGLLAVQTHETKVSCVVY